MKKLLCLTLAAALLCSCRKEAVSEHEQKPPTQYETESISMWDSETMHTLGYTNYTLLIFERESTLKKEVVSLDAAANILGQYGWEFISSENEGHRETYHLKRQYQIYGTFDLSAH